MASVLHKRIAESFKLTSDLANCLNNALLKQKIPNVRCNKLGEQFWCIIGARESYLKAIQNNEWSGFSCNLNDAFDLEQIFEKLKKTNEEILNFLLTSLKLTEIQKEFCFDLFTHEIQHHGQLIRFFYALNIEFPKSWNQKYTV